MNRENKLKRGIQRLAEAYQNKDNKEILISSFIIEDLTGYQLNPEDIDILGKGELEDQDRFIWFLKEILNK